MILCELFETDKCLNIKFYDKFLYELKSLGFERRLQINKFLINRIETNSNI